MLQGMNYTNKQSQQLDRMLHIFYFNGCGIFALWSGMSCFYSCKESLHKEPQLLLQ